MESNGPTKLVSTGDMDNSSKNTVSLELKACYPTTCSNILKLAYSPHNTLIATGVTSTSGHSGNITGISGLATISSNNVAMNKTLPNLGLPNNAINQSQNQCMSAGFTKIFINGTVNNGSK